MKKEDEFFSTNPEKATSRVAINGVMLASIFVMLAVIFLDYEKFNFLATAQMVLSIPFLFVSSLAYSKIGYWKETRLWDSLGYFTTTFGNYLMINAMGLVAAGISYPLAYSYFGLTIILLLTYSSINIYQTKLVKKQLFKFLFATAIIFLGGILPLIVLGVNN
ncbi:hypothetical protein EPO05_04090 [Patescibacteria group bacterium]|nr:MAG: hypothetical protein EPO05_04090 [Patescibacteria group bacterium]